MGIEAIGVLSGTLSGERTIDGRLSAVNSLKGSLSPGGTAQVLEEYTGEYTVVPSTDITQVLATANKLLTDDITVEVIRYVETDNLQDGKTVFIGY